jgi:hypothetical protein
VRSGSTTPAASRVATGSGARKAALPPGATTEARPGEGTGTAPVGVGPPRATGATGGEAGGEGAVGHPRPGGRGACGQRAGGEPCDQGGEGVVAPVVAGGASGREGEGAGPDDLDAWRELVHGRRHRLEGAGLAVDVDGQDGQAGAAPLRLPAAQAPSHPLGTSRGGARHHPVGVHHRHRLLRRGAGRHHRPVRAPHHERAHHGAVDPGGDHQPVATISRWRRGRG